MQHVLENELVLQVDEASAGARLDVFLRDRLRRQLTGAQPEHAGLGRAAITKLIENGSVRVDGRRISPSHRVRAGERIGVRGPTDSAALPDPNAPLELVREEPAFVVANKPAGMPTHPLAPGELGTLASALLARFPEMASFGYSPREPGIVHRLDTDTSGLVLAARTDAAFHGLAKLLEHGGIEKRYLALCAHAPHLASGEALRAGMHEAWLVAHGRRVHVHSLEAHGDARRIATEILQVTPYGQFTLVEVRVYRARRHQIRAHLAALDHPIAGDALYGGRAVADLARHFLHASELAFADPASGAAVHVRVGLPPELLAALEIAAQT